MAISAPQNNSVDTGLPTTPEQVDDPKAFNEFMLVYRAIKSVAARLAVASDQVIGLGQTWTDVKASRAAGTTYTNSTGRIIVAMVTLSQYTTTAVTSNFAVNGVIICSSMQDGGAAAYCNNTMTVIIPPGQTYSVSSFLGGLQQWMELR
jgi:hypothetical protein